MISCIKEVINSADLPAPPSGASYRPTSVFLLLFGKNEPYLLAIQKTDTEGYPWRNQVALPGGHVEKEDSSRIETAFRELKEELNITKDHVKLIGSTGHFQTISNRDIEVFVGLWDQKGKICYDSKEIARVLKVPFKELVKTHMDRKYHGRMPDVDELKYPHKDVIIWGVTAKILHFFIELMYPLIDEDGHLKGWKDFIKGIA